MKSTIRSNFASASLTVSLAIAIYPAGAFAQGSAGGSIGNDEKAISGSREAPRAVEPSKPARRSKPEAEKPHRTSRKSGGSGGGNLDGAWVVVGVGATCGSSTEKVVITGGSLVGQMTSGHVSPNGSTTGAGAAGGVSWTSSGRFSGRSGSGSFVRSDGCAGRWTASKQ